MAETFESPDERDFGNTTDLQDLSLSNVAFAEASLQGRLAELRADIIGKVLPLNIHRRGYAWAVYTYFVEEEPAAGLAYASESRQAMVLADSGPKRRLIEAPLIRIVEMEYLRDTPLPAVETTDITVLNNGQAKYLHDAISAPPEGHKAAATFSPHFEVTDAGDLRLQNFQTLTPYYRITELVKSGPVTVEPFGDASCFEDRVFVVDQAQRIIDAIKNLEPDAFGPKR